MLFPAELIFFLASLLLATFLIVLGERFHLYVQRGWYVIITAFILLLLGSTLELLDSSSSDVGIWASQDFIQTWVKQFVGYALSMTLLLLGLLLWAPSVVASRERYLTRIQNSERRYRLLTENASDMLSEHDLDGNFTFVTPASQLITGYLPEELEGRSIYEFIDPEQLELIQAEHAKILYATEVIPVSYRFRHKVGHFIWLESATRIYSTGEAETSRKILAVSRDISDRVEIEENLKSLNRSLDEQQQRVRLLYKLSASTDLSLEDQLQATLNAGVEHLGMDLGIISRIRGDEYKVLYFTPAESGLEKGQIFRLGDTYCSIALSARDIVAIDEMKGSQYASHPCYAAFKLESYIGVPITVDEEPFGTLNFSKPHPRSSPFTESDFDFVRLMGQWVSRVLEQAKATAALQQSEEKFRAVVRSAAVGVITMDPEGRIESFNESARKIFGYEKEEVAGKNIKMLMGPPESKEHDDHLRNYLIEGKTLEAGVTREVIAYRKSGEKIYLDLSVNEVKTETSHFFTGMVRDITAKKKAADDLANAHLQLKSIFNSATQVAIIATDTEGQITVFNPGAERMLGYSSDEIIGKRTDIFHLDSEVQQRSKELSQELGWEIKGFETYVALAKLGGFAEKEWTYVRKDGSQLLVDSAVTAMYDTTGTISGYLKIVLDVTQRKRAEDALKLAKSVAEAANQTKSEFLANMSHELRTPLNSVIGFSNIILRNSETPLDPKTITYLERILANGQHLLELINDILDLSKVEAGGMDLELVQLDVGNLIKDLLAQVESQVTHKPIELVYESASDLMEIKTDPGKLKQILLNLISNAIKFTDEGMVQVKVLADPDSKRPTAIQVTDTGIGIPASRIDYIFDEFEQVDSSTQRKYGGTGLGLSISRALCELMGYTLTVISEPGEGSTFTVKIPLTDPQLLSATAVRQETRTGVRRQAGEPTEGFEGKHLLLVDDDPDSQTLLAHYLKESGCSIETADSVSMALEAISKKRPDLITLDLQMPSGNGERLIQQLKADPLTMDIPVIVVSTTARESRGKIEGIRDFIQKPVNQQDFMWAVRRNIQTAPCCVLLVEDDPDMREVIGGYLGELQLELRVAGNGHEALEILADYQANLILLDLRMPEMDGLEFLEHLSRSESGINPRIIVITGKPISPAERVMLQNDQISILEKDQNFESELRRHLLNYFSKRPS